jgi:hypothetical protein
VPVDRVRPLRRKPVRAVARCVPGCLAGDGDAAIDYLGAADFPLPGLVAPVSVVPSAVPLAVPALGVIPDEKPVCGDAPAPGLLLALAALEFVRPAEPSWDNVGAPVPAPGP